MTVNNLNRYTRKSTTKQVEYYLKIIRNSQTKVIDFVLEYQ